MPLHIHRILRDEQAERPFRLGAASRPPPGIGQPQRHVLTEADIGRAFISEGGVRIAAARHQAVAQRHPCGGRAGIGLSKATRLGNRGLGPPPLHQSANIEQIGRDLRRTGVGGGSETVRLPVAAIDIGGSDRPARRPPEQMRRRRAIAQRLMHIGAQRQRIAARIASLHQREDGAFRLGILPIFIERAGEQQAHPAVARLALQQRSKLPDRQRRIMRLQMQNPAQQAHARHRIELAFGPFDQAARRLILARARGHHRLNIKSVGMAGRIGERAAGKRQRLRRLPQIGERRGIIQQGGHIGRVDGQCLIEPVARRLRAILLPR